MCCSSFIRNTVRKNVLLLCVLIPALSGCANLAALTGASLGPVPRTPGALITNEWSYRHGDSSVTVAGEWLHLPASEAGELLLWIENAENLCP